MTYCEICGKEVSRRVRHDNLKVCRNCLLYLNDPSYLLSRFISLQKEVDRLRKLNQRPSPFALIPPKEVLINAKLALDISNTYTEFSRVLAYYYKIEAPLYYHDPEKTPNTAIAAYFPTENVVRSKKPLPLKIGFHEFYHCLEKFRTAPFELDQPKREKNANLYAEACVKLLGE